MLRDVLACLVCGREHTGTTIVLDILKQHSLLDSGLEYGLLLNPTLPEYETSIENKIYYQRYPKTWGLSYEDMHKVVSASSVEEAYTLTKQLGSVSKDPNVRLIDKTPKYIHKLEEHIFDRTEDVPVIVMKRDPRNYMSSYVVKRKYDPNWTINTYKAAYDKFLTKEYQQSYGHRYKVFYFETFLLNPVDTIKEMFKYINIPYEESFNEAFFEKHMKKTPIYDYKKLPSNYTDAIKLVLNKHHFLDLERYQ